MHSSPSKRPPSSRLLHNLFKYCQSQYRYSPRRFIAIVLAIILFLLFGFIFIFTDFAAFIFRRGPRVVVFDDGVVEIIPDDIEEGKPYTFLNPELKKMSEYDDVNPQINDFDELDDVLERKFTDDDDNDDNENREETSPKRSEEKMKKGNNIVKTSNTNDRENPTKNHPTRNPKNHSRRFPFSKLKQTSTPDLIIIVAIRNLEFLSSPNTKKNKPLIPYSLFVSLAAAASTHQKQQKQKEQEEKKEVAKKIKFVFVLSPSASRVVQYDKEDFHEAMLETIRQSPPKLFRGENNNENRIAVSHQFRRSSSDFVFDGLSSSTIHPSLHDIGSYEVIFSGNEEKEEDLKEEEISSLSSLYQKGLESETVLSSRWMKMMNDQNTKEEDTHDSFFLFLSESVMPITPLNFISNLYNDLLSHQQQQLAAVQCGLASYQQRKKRGNSNKMSSSSPPPPFKDTLQNRLLEFKNRASKISSFSSSDGHFQHSELNEKVLRQIFTADDEDENEHEHEDGKNDDHKISSSIIKVIDAGWNVGISANLHADYHTNTMVSMTGPNVGFSLHSSGFKFGSSSFSTANISSDENRNKNNNDNNDHNNNIELVDAFGSNCIMIKESTLLKTISFFPIDKNNKNGNGNGKDGNKKYLIKGAFEPTSHHQFLSDVDLALAKNWLNSASHHLHLNQLALVDSLSHYFMLRHAVSVTATFRPEEDRDDDDDDDDEKTQNTNGNEEPTTTPTKKHLSDEEIANMLSMTLFDGKDDTDKKNNKNNNLVKEVLRIQNRLKKEADDENHDDENKNTKKKRNKKHKHGKQQKDKEFYELFANESELVMQCLSTKLNQDRTVEFDHVPNYFKSPEENNKRIQALERQHDDAEKDTRNKNAKSPGKKSFEEFSIYEKNQFDFDSDSYPIASYHEFFYEEVTDEVFSATSSRLNVDDWDRWNNKLNVREHQYNSELKSKFDRCDSFDSSFFNNNSYTLKKIQSLVQRHRLNMTKIYKAAMCYCDLVVAQVLERRRLLKALHSNYHHHHRSHHRHRRDNFTKNTNDNRIQENQQPKKENSSSSFTSLPLIPDASLGWSLSLRLRLLVKAENERIFGVSKRSAAFFVLPFVDENPENEEEATSASSQEQFNFIFSNFVFKPSFRLSAIERMFSPKTAAHHHHRHLHSDSKIFLLEDSSTTHDENFFMNRNWQKFALSLFPEYRRVIEQHHHQQRLLKQYPANSENQNENEKLTIAPAVPDHRDENHHDHVSHNNNNILSAFLQNHLPASFNSFLQKLHLTSKHLNSATTTTPFMKIHWHLADCCHCCGFSVEIAHLIRRLSEHYAVSLAQPAECYCQGLPAAFADTIGRSYQQDLKYFFSRLYPHEKILWVHHTPPPLFKNVPELGFGSRKPDRFIARSMYEFTRVGKDWVENVNIPDEWWAPSKFVKDLLVDDDLKVSPEKVFIIPESIDTKYFDPDAILEEQKIRMVSSTTGTTSQQEEHTSPTTTTSLDFSNEFNSRYGTDWSFVSCNRGPSRPSTKNKIKNKNVHHHHHARGQKYQQHDNEEDGDDDFAFLSQFKWEPRKGPTFLIEGFLRAFGSNTLKKELSMTSKKMMTTKNETGTTTIVNRDIPQFIRRNPTLMKRIQQQEKKRNERNRFSLRRDHDDEKEVEDSADQDVTLLILTGLYDLEHSPGLDLEAVNRQNVSNIIEIELVNYFRKKLFSSQSQAAATTRPHPLRFESDQVINDFIKSQILISPQHSPRFCLIGDSVTEKEMARIFRGADAFVLPTRGEGWGLPTMQAMSMGLPTISTNWGGSVDFTTRETSFLIDLDGLDEIPEWSPYLFLPGKKWSTPSISELTKLMQFVRSKKERKFVEEIGRRARRHIVKNFDDDEVWKVIDRRVKEIGQELISMTEG